MNSKIRGLGHIERTLFNNIDFAPSLYVRYVDDICAVFENDESKHAFFTHLNNQHPNLRFTLDEGGQHLPFLDVDLTLVAGVIETRVYRKATHTGVFLTLSVPAYLANLSVPGRGHIDPGLVFRDSSVFSHGITSKFFL